MGLFICTKCGCVDNTSLCTDGISFDANSDFPERGLMDMFNDGFFCLECNTGTWHDAFVKQKATEVEIIMSEQMIRNENDPVFTSHPMWRVYSNNEEEFDLTLLDKYKDRIDFRVNKAIKKVYSDTSFMFMSNGPYVRKHKKIGRNEPCHCDSGLKYKKCHYRLDELSND